MESQLQGTKSVLIYLYSIEISFLVLEIIQGLTKWRPCYYCTFFIHRSHPLVQIDELTDALNDVDFVRFTRFINTNN